MKQKKFEGTFISSDGHTYTADVICNSTIQAFFLLTADAIRSGKHYQLNTITDEKGSVVMVDDIIKVSQLLK